MRCIDLTLAIDCMHEMDKSIQYYLKLFNHFTKNFTSVFGKN